MKTIQLLCVGAAAFMLTGQLAQAASLGTAFTYQGRLFIGDVPANGLYDLQFTNYDAVGNALGGFNTNALPVTNGLFTVTLDFGAVFDGTPRWLEISERANGVGSFATLAPRQQLSSAPYAVFANSASNLLGTLPTAQLTGTFTGDGGGLTNLNVASFTGSVSNLTLTGNLNLPAMSPSSGVIYSHGSPLLSGSEDTGNSFVGPEAGNLTMSGTENTAIGDSALNNNTSGSFNTAIGSEAMLVNDNGAGNTADGYFALYENVSGSFNIALGYNAGRLITGNNNIDIGNPGVTGESGIIRIGTPGTHTTTLLVGNVGIGTTSPGHLLVVGGTSSPAYCDGTTWQNGSDRNGKEQFTTINPRAVLEKVSALPITEWKYKVEADGTEHLGPMAQDFHAAFGLNGADDKHIATVDEEGVALAAIQGLNQKLEETRAENADLRARLEKLERLLKTSK